jgi:hypothetical protein
MWTSDAKLNQANEGVLAATRLQASEPIRHSRPPYGASSVWLESISAVQAVSSVFASMMKSVFVILLLTGCTLQLAPVYDATIVDNLTKADKDALTLYANVSRGTTRDTVAKRLPDYNSVIGAFDAIRIDVNARANPTPKVPVPTASNLKEIIETLTNLRDTDIASGLKSGFVSISKGDYELAIAPALFYEKSLKR